MKREKFIRKEAKRAGVTEERLLRFHDVRRCECGTEDCKGWQLVLKSPERRRATTPA